MHSSDASMTVMHTQLSCKVYGAEPDVALKAAGQEVQRLEQVFSRFLPTSEVSLINANAGKSDVKISIDTMNVLEKALSIGKLSGGLFDVTIAPLMNLWDFTHAKEPPSQEAIDAVLPLVDYRNLTLDTKKHRAGLREEGMLLDLGGLAKGYSADCAKQVFLKHGISSAFINLGGNVLLVGGKKDGSAWKVGIRHPRLQNSLVGAISATDVSIVTSGDYERFFVDGSGRRFHHLVDPGTGWSSQSGIVSLTVVCRNSLHADALSTTLFLAGLDGCRKLLSELPDIGVFALDEQMMGWISPSLVPYFQPVEGLKLSLLSF